MFKNLKDKTNTLSEKIKKRDLNWKKILIWGVGAAFAFLILLPVVTYAYYYRDIGDKERLMNRNNSGLTLLDRNGETFFTFYQPKNKELTPLEDIPEHLIQAVIAAEDKEYYAHSGFSLRGIARAALINLKSGSIEQGGSTITQELVKNNLLSSKRSYIRKYQEVVLAYAVNNRYTKDEILEMYLNSVYFGEGAFGIENAAQTYFGISTNELDLSQSALLTGLLPAPSAYSPLSNDPTIANERQKIVLNEMVETGAITQEQADQAIELEIRYNPKTEEVNIIAPHFAVMIRDQLINEYGEEYVIRSGLTVKTTLNTQWQRYAEQVVNQQVSKLNNSGATNGAAVAVDPKTGEILVMVGSYDWYDDEFGKLNMAISPRQPGSSFKPIIYAEAIERRLITPATILNDEQRTFPGNYTPTNYDNRFRGPVTVRRALANSLNVPAVEVLEKLGVRNGLAAAERFGITTLDNDASHYGLSLVLGSGEVKLTELTNAYSVFANRGNRNDLTPVLEIKDKYGKVIMEHEQATEDVISDATAYLISSILSDTEARAETFGSSLNIGRTVAVKTGTTQDYRDSLTVGYTPGLAVGVWVGNNDNSPMNRVAGSSGAAPIWRLLMQNFLSGRSDETFSRPASVEQVTICITLSDGETATPSARTEFGIRGTIENQECDIPEPTPEEQDEKNNDDDDEDQDENDDNDQDNENEEQPTPTSTPQPSPSPTPPSITPTPIVTIILNPTVPENGN